ncbi:hypothetical protein Q3G72_014319 [Acer saccharum]|nr:hypothetical protein Q3G72_014319 [Acer saccharum]
MKNHGGVGASDCHSHDSPLSSRLETRKPQFLISISISHLDLSSPSSLSPIHTSLLSLQAHLYSIFSFISISHSDLVVFVFVWVGSGLVWFGLVWFGGGSDGLEALISSLNRRLLDLALSHLTFFVAIRQKIDAGRSHLKSFLTSAIRFY